MIELVKKSDYRTQGLLYRLGLGAFLMCCLMIFAEAAWSVESSEVVIVTSSSSQIKSLTLLDIRRLYLGFTIGNKGVGKPVINRVNEQLYAAFLKNIMHMTEEGYKRKIVRRVFRYGSDYVVELHSLDAIARHLKENPNDVVFVEKKDVALIHNSKLVLRLW